MGNDYQAECNGDTNYAYFPIETESYSTTAVIRSLVLTSQWKYTEDPDGTRSATDDYGDLKVGFTSVHPEQALNEFADESLVEWIIKREDYDIENDNFLTQIINFKDTPKEAAYVILKYSCNASTASTCKALPTYYISCYEGELVEPSNFENDLYLYDNG